MSAGTVHSGLKLKQTKTMIKTPLSLYTFTDEDEKFHTFTPWHRSRNAHALWTLVYQLHYKRMESAEFLCQCIIATG